MIDKTDPDRSKTVNLRQMHKIVRMCQAHDLELAMQAFRDKDKDATGLVRTKDALDALNRLRINIGTTSPFKAVRFCSETGESEVKESPTIDIGAFLETVQRHRRKQRTACRDNHGFNRAELETLQAKFNSFDANKNGIIDSKELAQLIEQAYPDMAHDPHMRARLICLLQQCDEDGNGLYDFREFLGLIRVSKDLMTEKRARTWRVQSILRDSVQRKLLGSASSFFRLMRMETTGFRYTRQST